jgi:hypothetical protein
MPTSPLSHHEILGLVEPFTRCGQRIDLATSDRAARRLRFKPTEHAAAEPALPAHSAALQLEGLDEGRFRLTRTLLTTAGLSATLEAEGSQPGELLAHIAAVPHARQLSCGTGFVIARCHRLEWLPAQRGRSAKVQRLVFASAAAVVDGFALKMTMSRVTGIPAHLQLSATQGDAAELPDDLLAVLGHPWARLIRVKDGWQSDLRLKGHMPDRGDDGERKFDRSVEHLARTLAEPPQSFHQRQLRARWHVVARRAVPLAASLGLIGAAAAVPNLQLAQDSVLRMLIFHAPPLLLVGFFCMRELPRIEIPRLPKPPQATSWRLPPPNR